MDGMPLINYQPGVNLFSPLNTQQLHQNYSAEISERPATDIKQMQMYLNDNSIELSHPSQSKQFVTPEQLSDKQRLELYEMRNSAIRELEMAREGKSIPDPYLKKYVKSIDNLLKLKHMY